MQNLKYDTKESIYKTETDSQTQRPRLVIAKSEGLEEEWIGSLGLVDSSWHIKNG